MGFDSKIHAFVLKSQFDGKYCVHDRIIVHYIDIFYKINNIDSYFYLPRMYEKVESCYYDFRGIVFAGSPRIIHLETSKSFLDKMSFRPTEILFKPLYRPLANLLLVISAHEST